MRKITLLSVLLLALGTATEVLGQTSSAPNPRQAAPAITLQKASQQQKIAVPARNTAPQVIVSPVQPGAVPKPAATTPRREGQPVIQIAILLDTSSSMSGLINQARAHLWDIVDNFSKFKQGDKRPRLEVALYEYGKSSLPASEGYIRQLVPLTDDLDTLSERLFALRTNGGSEHCGQVIDTCVKELDWLDTKGTLKAIFIAGNEAFTQGPVKYTDACAAAAGKNITVSTIHCGNEAAGISGQWDKGAALADGSFFNIDHNQSVVAVAAPQDKELAKLSSELNKTYLPYGSMEMQQFRSANQMAQDANVAKLGASVVSKRAASKASSFYNNAGWDLVDKVKNDKKFDITKVKKEELPKAMQSLKPEELAGYVAKMADERAKIQKQIAELASARDKYVAAERKKQAAEAKAAGMDAPAAALDAAINSSIEVQASKAGYTVPEKP